MRLPYVVVATVATLFAGWESTLVAADSNVVKLSSVHTDTADVPLVARVLNVDGGNTKRFLRIESTIDELDDSELSEERAIPGLSKVTEMLKPVADKAKPLTKKLTPMAEKLTDKTMAIAARLKPIVDAFAGKLKPIADKLMPILKPIAAKLNTYPIVQRVVTKFKEFVQKVKNLKVGEYTVSQRYTMAKFENWFKQNKSPDDVKAMLKVGTGPTVNTKNYDLWIQYTAFYRFSQREKEVKAAAAAAA
uniref:RxLR effector protein n=1 Tax=Phytophthora agathidicida TaxID=1642459 RepID=A0A7G4WI58_9STRA|nr:PaRXLR69 [Phytophthora agathidicida]